MFLEDFNTCTKNKIFKEISGQVDYVMHIFFKNSSLILIIILDTARGTYVIIALECQLLYQ